MIAAGMMPDRPITPNHNHYRPPFHPHLMSRVIDAAIEIAKHGIGFIGCHLVNRFGKDHIHSNAP
jgi:hypothetical protein